jgi:hypothetical protein
MLTRINARNFVWINKPRLQQKTEQIHNKYSRGGTATLRYFLSATFRRNPKKTFEHPACLPTTHPPNKITLQNCFCN